MKKIYLIPWVAVIAILLVVTFSSRAHVFNVLGAYSPYSPQQGGTGTSTRPSYGQVLVGNSSGNYDVVATSTLGITGTGNALIHYVSDNNIAANVTAFLRAWTLGGDEGNILMPLTGTIDSLYIKSASNSLNGNAVFTVKKNGVATALVVTFGAGVTSGNDTVNSISVSPGDIITITVDTTAASTGELGLYTDAALRVRSGAVSSALTGAGTAGQVTYWTSATEIAGNANFIWDSVNSRLGIGTSSPYAALSVVGDVVGASFDATTSTGYKQYSQRVLFSSTSTDFTSFTGSAGNLFVGIGSGTSTIPGSSTGFRNTFVGYWAGQANTTGSYNVALGNSALKSLLSGSFNTAIGYRTLELNVSGDSNTATGYIALTANTGSFNTAEGHGALTANTTGASNASMGYLALGESITGSGNAVIGSQGLKNNQSATSSVSVGADAATGLANYANQGGVYIGRSAGYSAASGSDYNTFIGYQAGYFNTVGANNIVLGANIDVASTTGSGSSGLLNIGNLIYGTGLYNGSTVSISPAGGKVGIGTSSPFATLSVVGDIVGQHLHSTSTAPAISSCGTSPSIVGSDGAGKVTLGTSIGVDNTCTLTFSKAWSSAPACMANNETQVLLTRAVSSVSTLTISVAATFTDSDVISYLCLGY